MSQSGVLMDLIPLIQQLLYRSVYVVMPFLICVTVVLLLDKVASDIGLLDKPSLRKRHDGAIPLVGGPAMFFAISASAVILAFHIPVIIFLILSAGLVVLGVLDDRYDIPAGIRLLVQALIAVLMITLGDIQIAQIGNIVGTGTIHLTGTFAFLFTVVCTIGVINSVNMIDGVDGLAGSILLISFSAMAYLSMIDDNNIGARMLAIFCGAILAFLCFNARVFLDRARIFMGDSGSMLMGFILAWFLIHMTQRDNTLISAVSAGWMFGLPLLDTMAVMLGRISKKQSPLRAGRDHLHHRLLGNGYSVNQTVLIMIAIHSVMVTIGVLGTGARWLEPFMFWGFVLISSLHVLITPRYLPVAGDKENSIG